MSTAVRVALAVGGLLVLFLGTVLGSLEANYGSGKNFALSSGPSGDWVVSEIDEHGGTAVVVFEGTEEEAIAYTEAQRSTNRNFLIPGLLMAAGALAVVAALTWPLWHRFRRRTGTVQ